MAMSIDGLVSGMSTTDTIAQLMQVEALPQKALQTKVTTQNKVVSAFQSINSRVAAVASAAKTLGSPDTWGTMKSTTSSAAAVVSAKPGAAAGSLSFRVEEVAAAHLMTFKDQSVASAGDSVLNGSTFDVLLADGVTTKTLTPKDGSLASVVAAINADADLPYKAAAVQTGPGKYTLQMSAKTSGATAAFTDANLPTGINLGTATTTVQGRDAVLKVGDTADAYEVTSATNTFNDVLPGVTVTAVSKQAVTDAPVTIGLTADTEAIAGKVQALIDGANVALQEIASQSKVKNGTLAAGPLVGDSAVRKLSQDILSAVGSGAGSLGSLSAVGVGLDRSGQLTFDKTKFTEAYTADPAKTQSYFDSYTEVDSKTDVNPGGKGTANKFEPGWDTAHGLARKLETLALVATEGVTSPADPQKARQGTLAGLIQRRNETIRSLGDQVLAWDVRLEQRKTALEKKFSGLEVALGKMQQQSTWLAGQLAGLS